MAAAFWLALQAAAAPVPAPAPVPAGLMPVAFDLASFGPALSGPIAARRCDRAGADAIVVCGRRAAGDYPLAEWALVFPPEGPLRAEMGLGGGATGRLYGETVILDRGAVSQRAMVGISIPF